MADFREVEKQFRRLSETARILDNDAGVLINEALGLARQEAFDTLNANLSRAIAFGGEFQREPLESRLYRHFGNPKIVAVDEEVGVTIQVDEQGAQEQWLQAQAYANYSRNREKTTYGWAAVPTPAQRRAYWRNKVYHDDVVWTDTIETRLSFLSDPDAAPFWYFLEYGTGPGAYPQIAPQRFIQKTRDETGGHKLVNKYFSDLLETYAQHAAKALNVAAVSTASPRTIVEQEVRWTKWYTYGNKQRRHQYIAGKGQFLKGGIETK